MVDRASSGASAPGSALNPAFLTGVLMQPVSQGIYFTMPFTIMVYMVSDFGMAAGDPSAVGRLTGYLGSMSHFGSLLAAVPWGMVSDRVGRKPVIMFGNIFAGVSMLVFGVSRTYATVMLARFVGGLGNGVIGSLKTLIGEASEDDNQAKVMSYLSTGWGVGAVLGPMLGGLLSNPCSREAGLLSPEGYLCDSGYGIFARFPYLLPCIVCAVFNTTSTVVAYLYLPETLMSPSAGILPCWPATQPKQAKYQVLEMTEGEDQAAAKVSDTAEHASPNLTAKRFEWYRDRQCVTFLTGYGILAFTFTLLDEVVPIYSAASRDAGGLHLTSQQLSGPLSISGACLLAYTAFCYPYVVAWLGLFNALTSGLLLTMLPILAIPLISLVPPHLVTLQLVLMSIFLGTKSVFSSSAFTSSIVLVNKSAPPGQLAVVNGVGQTISSLVRALGPTVGGTVWALSSRSHLPGKNGMVFGFAASCCAAGVIMYRSRGAPVEGSPTPSPSPQSLSETRDEAAWIVDNVKEDNCCLAHIDHESFMLSPEREHGDSEFNHESSLPWWQRKDVEMIRLD